MPKEITFEEIHHRKPKHDHFDAPNHRLPETGFLRLWQIIGGKGYPALIPISRSAFWKAVAEGRFPAPVHLGPRTSAWRVSDVRALIESESAHE